MFFRSFFLSSPIQGDQIWLWALPSKKETRRDISWRSSCSSPLRWWIWSLRSSWRDPSSRRRRTKRWRSSITIRRSAGLFLICICSSRKQLYQELRAAGLSSKIDGVNLEMFNNFAESPKCLIQMLSRVPFPMRLNFFWLLTINSWYRSNFSIVSRGTLKIFLNIWIWSFISTLSFYKS